MMKRIYLVIAALCFLAPSAMLAQSTDLPSTNESCRVFVQQFYDWYEPTSEHGSDPAWIRALKQKPDFFDPELSRKLKQEDAFETKFHDPGLDMDPLFNSQDPGDRYLVRGVKRTGNKCWANVHAVYSGRTNRKVSVIPELRFTNRHWVFVNFHYEHDNLRNVLENLRRYFEKAQGSSN